GGLIGNGNDATLSGTFATGTVTVGSGASYVGGLAGQINQDVTGSYAKGAVLTGDGAKYVGGLIGAMGNGSITTANAIGPVTT
ncbi:GLUG motif-containing protein, partial [Acinetobacter baumannii]